MGRGRGAAASGRKPGNPVLRVKPAPAVVAALRRVGGALARLVVERTGDRDAVLVMADARVAIAEAEGGGEEREGGDDAGVTAPPLGCATLCRHAFQGA